MNRRSAIQSLLAAGAGSLFSRSLSAIPQRAPEGDSENYTLRSEIRLVLLDVSVKDKSGAVVSGLSKENFSVLENGHPQRIAVFAHEDVPVTIGILVDQSKSMTPKWSDVLTAAEIFIEESNRQDEIFILHFNDSVTSGLPGNVPFSDDIQQLRAALGRGVPEGKTALNDAVVVGLQKSDLGTRDKKTLVVISDGGDNASEYDRADTLAMVQRSISTIYTIGLFEADDPDRDPSLLRKLANISGGEAYFPDSASEMTPICRRIAKDIRTRYTVGYYPEASGGSLRHIRVRASVPGHRGLTVRSRMSYQYDEIEAGKSK